MSTKHEQDWNRMSAQRERHVGRGSKLTFEDKAFGVQVYFWPCEGRPGVVMLGFSGKRCKPDFRYFFRSTEDADKYCARWLQSIHRWADVKRMRRAERAAKMAEPHRLQIGDVLVSSWGYEQTNYDYYEVTRLVGTRSVEIYELAQARAETGWLRGDCVPIKGRYKGDPMVKRVAENGNAVKVREVWAHKKESRNVGGVELFTPDSYTAYA